MKIYYLQIQDAPYKINPFVSQKVKLFNAYSPLFSLGRGDEHEYWRACKTADFSRFFSLGPSALTAKELGLHIDVRRPSSYDRWECSITIDGKEQYHADMCLVLEKWRDELEDVRSYAHSQERCCKWEDQTFAYYSGSSLNCEETEELDPAAVSFILTNSL